MNELCWLNGQVMPLSEAKVSVEDRGFLFADGVYEALRVYNGKPLALAEHLDRLERSLAGIELPLPVSKAELHSAIVKLVNHSGLTDAVVYLQVTRGPAPRNHLFPKDPKPTTFFYVRSMTPLPPIDQIEPYTLLSVPDERWARCWIKSIALLSSTLARNAAERAGADEAIFVDNGIVREGASTNLFAVIDRQVVTHPTGSRILTGVTRDLLLRIARDLDIPVAEREMTLDQAQHADEVFLSSSVREVMWVGRWDGLRIGEGSCGPITRRLHEEYRQRVQAACGRARPASA
jgi:D-alanine transaminase